MTKAKWTNITNEDWYLLLHKSRHLWINRLKTEYDHIVWLYKIPLNRPIISVTELSGAWGQWHADRLELTISSELIRSHPWTTVVEILKHEMAHQLAMKHGHNHTHGPEFDTACEQLRVAPWARRASGALRDLPTSDHAPVLSSEDERLLTRTTKLLALAESANEHEASIAIAKVQELYRKHNLESLTQKKSCTITHQVLTRYRKRFEAYENQIIAMLHKYFSVEPIYTEIYCPAALTTFKAVELNGSAANLAIGAHIYYYLVGQCESRWQSARRNLPSSRKSQNRQRHSYMTGLIKGFVTKLERNKKKNLISRDVVNPIKNRTFKENSIQTVQQYKLIDRYVASRHPRLVSKRSRHQTLDRTSYQSGIAEGSKIKIRRPLTSDGSQQRRIASN